MRKLITLGLLALALSSNAGEEGAREAVVTTSGTTAVSSKLSGGYKLIYCSAATHYHVGGSTVTATTVDLTIPATTAWQVFVAASSYIAFILDSSTGTCSIYPQNNQPGMLPPAHASAGGSSNSSALTPDTIVATGSITAGTDNGAGEAAFIMSSQSYFCVTADCANYLTFDGSNLLFNSFVLPLSMGDWSISAVNLALSGTGIITTGNATGAASTITAANWTPAIAGVGVGNFVTKLCGDSTCSGTTYVTCTAACTATVKTVVACTVNTGTLAKAATPYVVITTACGTTNPQGNFFAALTQP